MLRAQCPGVYPVHLLSNANVSTWQDTSRFIIRVPGEMSRARYMRGSEPPCLFWAVPSKSMHVFCDSEAPPAHLFPLGIYEYDWLVKSSGKCLVPLLSPEAEGVAKVPTHQAHGWVPWQFVPYPWQSREFPEIALLNICLGVLKRVVKSNKDLDCSEDTGGTEDKRPNVFQAKHVLI